MKTPLQMLVGLCLLAGAAFANTKLSVIPFVVGQQQFNAGDSIIVDQVLASAPRLEPGTRVVVRGHYQLASADQASLGLFVTHRSAAGPDPSDRFQVAPASHAGGSFELSCEITYDGDLHVSFYPATGGEAFGGVYISGPPRKS